MARQYTLGTIKNVATRIARTTARTSIQLGGRAVDEVSTRITARRASTPDPVRTFPTAPPDVSATRDAVPAAERSPERGRMPLPTDVARVVARNAAGLARVAPSRPERKPRPSGPGAKLPARRGQGILGV